MNLIRRLIVEEEGQGLVEYVLIIGVVSLAAVLAMTATGTSISGMWTKITTEIDKVLPSPSVSE